MNSFQTTHASEAQILWCGVSSDSILLIREGTIGYLHTIITVSKICFIVDEVYQKFVFERLSNIVNGSVG